MISMSLIYVLNVSSQTEFELFKYTFNSEDSYFGHLISKLELTKSQFLEI